MYKLLILFFISLSSIHKIEYFKHIKEAKWTPISTKKQHYTPLKYTSKGMLKNYYGYLPYWVDTTYYQYFKMNLLTHIAYFSVGIDPSTGNLGDFPNVANFNKIRDYAHERGVRVHMTFTIFGSSNVSSFLNSNSARTNAINNIKNLVSNYGCDGVNIDFEFVTSSVRDSFNEFIHDLSDTLWNDSDGRKELYIAMPAVPEWYPGYDYAYLANHSDGLFIMAYDFHYSGSSDAGPVSPAVPSSFWGEYSVAKSIGSYKQQGVPGSKIILGLPYYGYDWPTSSGDMGSSTTGSGSAVIYYYAHQHANTYGRLWDNYSLTPWYKYDNNGWHQCWYDDSESIAIKLSMVNDSNLQGAGCWALGYDRSYNYLWNAIKGAFWIEPPTRHWTVEVNTDRLNVREGPGTNYKVIGVASMGEKFVAFDYYSNQGFIWYKIYFPSASGPYYAWVAGGDGINTQYLKGTTQNKILRVTASLLNVREGPGTSYNIITAVANGEVFVEDSITDNWARIYLPLNNDPKGWLSLSYVDSIVNPEDYNTYNCEVEEVLYPDSAQVFDTFSIRLKIQNTGYAPFDTLVYLRGEGKSPFYNPSTWEDTTRAKLTGFWGLPGQVFYTYGVFSVPEVPQDTTIIDTFQFERKGVLFGSPIIISVTVHPVGVKENTKKGKENTLTKGSILFNNHIDMDLSFLKGNAEVIVYNAMGQKVMEKKLYKTKKINIGKGLSRGVYFLVIKSKNTYIKRKIIKIE